MKKRECSGSLPKQEEKNGNVVSDGSRNIKDSLFVALFNNESAA
jgi:hypothetical protein